MTYSRLKRHLAKKKSTLGLAPTQFKAVSRTGRARSPEAHPRTHTVRTLLFLSVHSLSTAEMLAAAVPKGEGSCGSGGRGRETP
eukprot:scaffold20190_cov48-Phaeocystis_antarctica.AAC.3